MRYVNALDEVVEQAASIDANFRLAGTGQVKTARISVEIDNQLPQPFFLVFSQGGKPIHRIDRVPFGTTTVEKAFRVRTATPIRIDVLGATFHAFASGRPALKRGLNTLHVTVLPDYPPVARFNGAPVVAPGVGYDALEEVPYPCDANFLLFLRDQAHTFGVIPSPYDIWIDGKKVEERNAFDFHFLVPVFHRPKLSFGRHRVLIADPKLRKVLVDTDIIINGLDETEVVLDNQPGEVSLQIVRDLEPLIDTSLNQWDGEQGLFLTTPQRTEIDGFPLPPGLERNFGTLNDLSDRLKKDKKFSEDMRDNYRNFINRRKEIRAKKDAGKALTPEETKLLNAGPKEMQDFVEKRKKAKGYKLQEAGKTDGGGNKETTTPPPKTPYDFIQEYITDEIHEPSHVDGVKADLAAVGLDFKDWQKFYDILKRLRSGKPVTADERKFFRDFSKNNKKKIDDYIDRRNDADRIAAEEAGEYQKEVDFYNALLALLPFLPLIPILPLPLPG